MPKNHKSTAAGAEDRLVAASPRAGTSPVALRGVRIHMVNIYGNMDGQIAIVGTFVCK
jgi:hypothetical protein